jgi:hypothetical protein
VSDHRGTRVIDADLQTRFTIIEKVLKWLGITPTTPLTIVVGLGLSIIYVLWALTADSLGKPITEITLNTIGLFCSSLVFAGVTQFGVKRFSDDKALAAKHGTSAPTREPRATTTVARVDDEPSGGGAKA